MAMWGGQSYHTVGTGQTLTPDPACREAKRSYLSGTQDVGLPAPRLLAVVKTDRDNLYPTHWGQATIITSCSDPGRSPNKSPCIHSFP